MLKNKAPLAEKPLDLSAPEFTMVYLDESHTGYQLNKFQRTLANGAVQSLYYLKLESPSKHKSEWPDFSGFRPELKKAEGHILIINCAEPISVPICLPDNMDCYLASGVNSQQVNGNYKRLTRYNEYVLRNSLKNASSSEKTTSKRKADSETNFKQDYKRLKDRPYKTAKPTENTRKHELNYNDKHNRQVHSRLGGAAGSTRLTDKIQTFEWPQKITEDDIKNFFDYCYSAGDIKNKDLGHCLQYASITIEKLIKNNKKKASSDYASYFIHLHLLIDFYIASVRHANLPPQGANIPHARYGATILHKIASILKISPSLIRVTHKNVEGLLILIATHRPNARDIANTFWSLGKLVEANPTLASDLIQSRFEPITVLLQALPKQSPNAQAIANTLWSLGKLVEANPTLVSGLIQSRLEPIKELLQALPHQSPNAQDIANTFWSLSKLVEANPTLASDLIQSRFEPIKELLQALPHQSPNAQDIANTLWSLGKLVEANPTLASSLIQSRLEAIKALLQALPHQSPFAQEIANTLWSLGKLVEANPTLASCLIQSRLEAIKALLQALSKQSPDAQAIANTFWSLGKLVEAKLELASSLIQTQLKSIKALLQALPKQSPNAQDIANTFWSLSKLVEANSALVSSLTKPELEALKALLQALPEQSPNAQEIANTLWSLSKLVGAGSALSLWPQLEPIKALLQRLPHQSPKTQEIANTFWSLGKFVEVDSALASSLIQPLLLAIKALLQALSKQSPNAQDIANTLWSLGKFVEVDSELTSSLIQPRLVAIKALLQALPEQSPDAQAIANTLWSLGKLLEVDSELASGLIQPRLVAIKALLQALPKQSPTEQNIANTLWSLGKLVKANPALASSLIWPEIGPIKVLLQALPKQSPDAQAIANTLWSLGKLVEAEPALASSLIRSELETIQELLQALPKQSPNAQAIANTLLSLGKLVEADPALASSLIRSELETIQELLQALPKQSPNAQAIANTLWSLGKLVETDPALASSLIRSELETIQELLQALPKQSPNAQAIANAFRGLSHLSAQSSMHSALPSFCSAHVFNELVQRYVKKTLLFKTHALAGRAARYQMPWHLNFIEDALNLLSLIPPSATLAQDCFDALVPLLQYLSQKQLGAPLSRRLNAINEQFASLLQRQGIPSLTFNQQNQAQEQPELEKTKDQPAASSGLLLEKLSAQLNLVRTSSSTSPNVSYDIENEQAMAKLEASAQGAFSYDFKANKERLRRSGARLRLAPVHALNRQLGLFARNALSPSNTTMGSYHGEFIPAAEEAVRADSLYAMNIASPTNPEEVIGIIDADKVRDWTAYINHSAVSNVRAEQKTVRGKSAIYFYIAKPIKQGEQLLFDYGPYYFSALDFKPYYLHATDNDKTDQENYLQQQSHYAEGLYQLDPAFVREYLSVSTDAPGQWLIPQVMLAVMEQQTDPLKKCLAQQPADLPAYHIKQGLDLNQGIDTLDEHWFTASIHQPHFTAIMLACYLGQMAPIYHLLAKEVDLDRYTFNTGYSALMFLLEGRATVETVEDIGRILLEKMQNPFVYNIKRLGLLHYALRKNTPVLLTRLLDIAIENKEDIFSEMLFRDLALPAHADLDECLRQGHYELLQILLTAVLSHSFFLGGQLQGYIKEGVIFSNETLAALGQEKVNEFKSWLAANFPNLLSKELSARLSPKASPIMPVDAQSRYSLFYNSNNNNLSATSERDTQGIQQAKRPRNDLRKTLL